LELISSFMTRREFPGILSAVAVVLCSSVCHLESTNTNFTFCAGTPLKLLQNQ
jgi:hypothetical protein